MSAYDKWKTTDVDGDRWYELEPEAERRFIAEGADFDKLTDDDWNDMIDRIEADIADDFQEPDAY